MEMRLRSPNTTGTKHLAVATVHSSTNFSPTITFAFILMIGRIENPAYEGKEAVLKAYNDSRQRLHISILFGSHSMSRGFLLLYLSYSHSTTKIHRESRRPTILHDYQCLIFVY